MTKNEKNPKGLADAEDAHKNEGDAVEPEPLTQFEVKVNKYGFLHVPKKVLPSLPFKVEQPLEARIDGNHLIIAVATEKQTK